MLFFFLVLSFPGKAVGVRIGGKGAPAAPAVEAKKVEFCLFEWFVFLLAFNLYKAFRLFLVALINCLSNGIFFF